MIIYYPNKYFTYIKVFNKIIKFFEYNIAFKNKNIKESKKFICPFKTCQKTYGLKNILLAHLRTHYNIKPFICSYCNKSFNEKGNLKTHIRIHTGERPFKCKKCQKGFKALGQLKDHLILHTGFKPFQCPHCKKYYRRKEILKNHFIIHAKEPYFQNNQEEFQEMLNNVKTMKNILYNFDNSDLAYSSKGFFNNSISKNEDIKSNLIIHKKNISEKLNKKRKSIKKEVNNIHKNKKIFVEIKLKNEIKENNENRNNLIDRNNFNNEFLINLRLFKDDYALDWPNLSELNDSMPSTDNISLKEDIKGIENELIKLEDRNLAYRKAPGIAEKAIDFSLKNKINDLNFYFNISGDKNNDDEENEDCCSKMTNLYIQEYGEKKINNNYLE